MPSPISNSWGPSLHAQGNGQRDRGSFELQKHAVHEDCSSCLLGGPGAGHDTSHTSMHNCQFSSPQLIEQLLHSCV